VSRRAADNVVDEQRCLYIISSCGNKDLLKKVNFEIYVNRYELLDPRQAMMIL